MSKIFSKYKTLLKWGFAAFGIWLAGEVCYEGFIKKWRYDRAEARVKKSIVRNFEQRREAFRSLENYARQLEPMQEVEFLGRGKIRCCLRSDSTAPEGVAPLDLAWDEFQFLENQTVKVKFFETYFETKNWYWTFEGNKQHPHYQQFIKVARLSEARLDSLEFLLKNADCEAIEIYQNQKFSARFDGHWLSKFEYYFSDSLPEALLHYSKLDEDVFCGEFKQPLFCGRVLYKK